VLIPKTLPDCVCFICGVRSNGDYEPLGTGFFLGVPIANPESPTWVAVVITALHVINQIEDVSRADKRIFLRVNTKEGGVDYIHIPEGNWIRPDIEDQLENGIVDAAVCWFPGNNTVKYDYLLMPSSNEIAFNQLLDDEDIGIGEDVFFTGLFIRHTETQRNEPIIRSGVIAAMPKTISIDRAPGKQHAFLVESRSMGGFSGSPVFVAPGLFRFDEDGKPKIRPTFGASYLIGVISGHWEAKEEIQILGDLPERASLNMGIAKVTPMEKVFPLIEQCIAKFRAGVTILLAVKQIADIGKAIIDVISAAAAAAQQGAAAAPQDLSEPPDQPASTETATADQPEPPTDPS
jgi:hypothetical protein